MGNIIVPTEGRPAKAPGADPLGSVDGNAFSIMGRTRMLLQKAGASRSFRDAYSAEAMSGDYEHLLAASVAYLEAEAAGGEAGYAPLPPKGADIAAQARRNAAFMAETED